jgi:hypothetical protein
MLLLVPLAAVSAEVRATPAEVFEAAVNDHYTAMHDGQPCVDCEQKVVLEKKIRGATVQLRKATTSFGDVYGIVYGNDNWWAAADPIDDIQVDDCGMGKCVTETIRTINIVRDHDAMWAFLRVDVRIDHTERPWRSHSMHERDIVIGCSLTRDSSCATVTAGRAFLEGHARRRGSTVHVVEQDAARDVDVTF